MNMNPIKSTSLQSMNAVKTQPYFVQWYFFGNQIKQNHATITSETKTSTNNKLTQVPYKVWTLNM